MHILGVINTELYRHAFDRYPKIIHPFLRPFLNIMKTPFHGAQTTLYCCLEDSIENESGLYYSDCDKKLPSKHGQNDEMAKKLWDLSEKMVGLKRNKNQIFKN